MMNQTESETVSFTTLIKTTSV